MTLSDIYHYTPSQLYSNCCGAAPVRMGDNDSIDYGICPACGEHCEFISEDEFNDDSEWDESDAPRSDVDLY